MSSGKPHEQKIRELWKIQLELNKYVGETETELDPAIEAMVQNISIPQWFNSGFVFSHLVLAMDSEIQEIGNDIYTSQETLKELFKSILEKRKAIQMKKEGTLTVLKNEVDALDKEVQSMKDQEVKQEESNSSVQTQFDEFFNAHFKKLSEELITAQTENQEYINTINAYMEEIEISTNQIIAQCDDFKNNQIITKKYKQQIVEMTTLKERAEQSMNVLSKRTESLKAAVAKLQKMRDENDKTYNELVKDEENNKLITEQFQNVQESIKVCQKKQEEALNEMINSIELAEDASAEVKMHQYEYDYLNEEKDRIRDLIYTVGKNLNDAVSDFEVSAHDYYNQTQKTVNSRLEFIKAEQIKLMHEKDSLEHQVELAKDKLKKISPNVIAENFTNANSTEYLLKLKEDVERIFEQKEALLKKISELKCTISKNKEKLLSGGYKNRKEISALRSRRQVCEVDLSILRGNLKSILQKNGVIAEDNQKIKSYIENIRRKSTLSLSHILQDKEEAIEKLQQTIEKEKQENDAEVQAIEHEISKFNLIAEQFSNEKDLNKKQFRAKNNAIKEENRSAKQQIRTLKQAISENQEQLIKGQNLLNEAQAQVNFLIQNTQQLSRKDKYQRAMMEQAKLEQIALVTEIDKYKETERKLDKKIEEQRRNLFQSSKENPDYLQTSEIHSDPL